MDEIRPGTEIPEASLRLGPKTLALMIGVQGAGKSTFYKQYLDGKLIRINLDTLHTRGKERELFESCLANGDGIAVDNTNPVMSDRARYIPDAKNAGYRVIGFFLCCPVSDCLTRNAGREGKERIPEKGVYATWRRLELPSFREGFDALYIVENDGESRMRIYPWNAIRAGGILSGESQPDGR